MKRAFRLICVLLSVLLLCLSATVSNAATSATSIETCYVIAPENQAYNGQSIKPEIMVRNNEKILIENVDYTLTFDNNKEIGIASVIIKGKGKYKDYIATSFQIVPATVQNLKQTKRGAKSVSLKWDAVFGATEYYVKNNKNGKILAKTKDTSAIIKNLKASRVYNLSVCAASIVDSVKYTGYYCDPVYFATKVNKPTLSSVKYTKQGRARINFKNTTSVEGYRIVYSKSKKFKNNGYVDVKGNTKKSVTLKKLAKGRYYVKIRSFKDNGYVRFYSAFSKVKSVKILKGAKKPVLQTTVPPSTTIPKPTAPPKDVLDTTGIITSGDRVIVQTIIDQAETLQGTTTDDKSRPVYGYLPMGTLDYAVGDEIKGSSTYRLLNCGQRVYTKTKYHGDNIKIIKGTLPETNSVSLASANIVANQTVVTINTQWKAPFLLNLTPQDYRNPTNGDYSIDSATYKYVDILFYYAKKGQGKPDLSNNPLFKGSKWIKDGNNYKLRLTLRNVGSFYGYSARYNSQGQLEFSFLNPAKVTASNNAYGYSLAGVKIAIDAGHGGYDPGAVGADGSKESVLNMMLAQYVKTELESIGATVIMTRTDDTYSDLEDRVVVARNIKPDLFISIHRNASDNTSVKGFSSYYYNPYSKALASNVYNSCTASLNKLGVLYYPFYVTRFTDCPAILTENGFVTNSSELSLIKTEEFNKNYAKEFTKGIVNYLVSIN